MNKQEIDEVIQSVDNINKQLYEQLGPDTTALVTYTYTTYAQWVEWNGIHVWDSENECRKWIEEDTEDHPDGERYRFIPAHYEDMEPYLKKKIMEIITEVSKIKL